MGRTVHGKNAPPAVLLDVDGVLAATETLKARAHVMTCKRFGGDATVDVYRAVIGQSSAVVRDAFRSASGIAVDDASYLGTFRSIYGELLDSELQPVPGAPELVLELSRQGVVLAAVSSSERRLMDRVLRGVGLQSFFATSVAADEVTAAKPSPEPFLAALAALDGVDGSVVLEDSDPGVLAARRAGLPVIALRHELNAQHAFPGAAAVLLSLQDTADVVAKIASLVPLGGS
jgi:HAD superfamily hydrolase (TIGR01509 family)